MLPLLGCSGLPHVVLLTPVLNQLMEYKFLPLNKLYATLTNALNNQMYSSFKDMQIVNTEYIICYINSYI